MPGKTPEPSLAMCECRLRMCKELIDAAMALQRNAPISFIYCPNEAFRFNEALSLREDIEFLREMTGLSGRGLKWPRSADRGSMEGRLTGGPYTPFIICCVQPLPIVSGSLGAPTRRASRVPPCELEAVRIAGLACSAEAGTG